MSTCQPAQSTGTSQCSASTARLQGLQRARRQLRCKVGAVHGERLPQEAPLTRPRQQRRDAHGAGQAGGIGLLAGRCLAAGILSARGLLGRRAAAAMAGGRRSLVPAPALPLLVLLGPHGQGAPQEANEGTAGHSSDATAP